MANFPAIPRPGKPGGPCPRRCEHLDCAVMRLVAESARCIYCLQKIDYERRHVDQGSLSYAHQSCNDEERDIGDVIREPRSW